MYLKSLQLRNYRNYSNETILLSPSTNVIVGDNAAGKTNLLESIYLLSTTRSHRNDDDRELIKFDNEFASVEGILESQVNKEKLSVVIHKTGKTLAVNNIPLKKNSQFIGRANAVLFSPSNMDLFDNSPRFRRKLIDIELGKLSPTYMFSLSNYLKLLKERNTYLKSQIDNVMLETYTEMLFEPQIEIIQTRDSFVNDLNKHLSRYYNLISGESHQIEMRYQSITSDREDKELMLKELQQTYQNNLERDIFLKQTSTGIHREDYIFYLDGKEVSKFCSQGQKRMVLLALKLSTVENIYDVKNDYPVLLLDDVFSELDQTRRHNLLEILPSNIQTIITTTDLSELNLPTNHKVNVVKVQKGMIEHDK